MDKKQWRSETQEKNLAWMLPRPKPDRYPGGMPLYAEAWLLDFARYILVDCPEPSILNLFCGMNIQGFRVDIKKEVNPDLVCDAHELTKHLDKRFDIILADPPYSTEEAKDMYGTPPLKYKQWTSEATKLLDVGGLLIVYHKYLMPNPDPEVYSVFSRVFIGNRTYHTPRVAVYFEKRK